MNHFLSTVLASQVGSFGEHGQYSYHVSGSLQVGSFATQSVVSAKLLKFWANFSFKTEGSTSCSWGLRAGGGQKAALHFEANGPIKIVIKIYSQKYDIVTLSPDTQVVTAR